jgi:hypothetical protein
MKTRTWDRTLCYMKTVIMQLPEKCILSRQPSLTMLHFSPRCFHWASASASAHMPKM